MTDPARDGFSLAEALVVLAVTSGLLILLAQTSAGASRAGFRLAARADAAADRRVGLEAVRTLLRGVRLPVRGGRTSTPFVGNTEGFNAAVTPGRATPCGDGAPTVVALRIDRTEGRSRLVCSGRDGSAEVLLDLGSGPAAFSYALAGRPWSERLTAQPPAARATSSTSSPPPAARLWIRIAAAEGVEVVESVDPPASTSSPASASSPSPAAGSAA